MMQYIVKRSDDYLEHHGVQGQKWGIRRYQDENGNLTAEGQARYSQQGWEARQQYKRGEISKEQKRQAMKAGNIIGKIDNVANLGFGRRIREFRDRHKKGIMACSIATGIIGTATIGALTGGAALPMVHAGAAAVGSIIGTGLGTVTNRAILDYGYNRKLNGKKSYSKNAG